MKAIESPSEIEKALTDWRRSLVSGASHNPSPNEYWHQDLDFWVRFSKHKRRDESLRNVTTFGQLDGPSFGKRVVEINVPVSKVDSGLQAMFAVDEARTRWVLRKGRMRVPGGRVTDREFTEATGLMPKQVYFRDGVAQAYFPVAPIDAPPLQCCKAVAAFIDNCALARSAKVVPQAVIAALKIAEGNGIAALVDDLTDIYDRVEKPTERKRLVAARLGQGKFRAGLEARWKSVCAISGCSTRATLRASHIKPWKTCNDRERLDPDNGLLLAATLDALFDRGLISFAENGDMLMSPQLCSSDRKLLKLPQPLLLALNECQRSYLADHRANFGYLLNK